MPYKFFIENGLKTLLLTAMLSLLTMALGCSSTAVPQQADTTAPTSEKQRPLARLSLIIEPPEVAVPLFNPTPLSDDNLSFIFGEVVTINLIPKEGWEIIEWIGPVESTGRNQGQITMTSSQSIGVKLGQINPDGMFSYEGNYSDDLTETYTMTTSDSGLDTMQEDSFENYSTPDPDTVEFIQEKFRGDEYTDYTEMYRSD